WDQHAEAIIVAGLGILWAASVYEATVGLGGAVADALVPDLDTVVLAIVLGSLLMSRKDVAAAVAHVEANPELRSARDDFLAGRRDNISATPAI
ncbi:hypothetical protein RA997_23285, partial [Mycobacteroides abscessus subsp. abscessus]